MPAFAGMSGCFDFTGTRFSVADLTFLPGLPRVICRNVKSKATLEIVMLASAAFRFEVPNRVCRDCCRNFKSAALASAADALLFTFDALLHAHRRARIFAQDLAK